MATKKVATAKVAEKVASMILGTPRVTEKAARLGERRVYTFTVHQNATKSEIIKEITRLYKVTPIKVNTTQIADKVKFARGAWGTKRGGKKAVVFLKEGDSIAFV